RHWRRASMALETGDLPVVPDDALAAVNDADGLVLSLQQRPLLDMQLDKGAELALSHRLAAAIADAVERFADTHSSSVLPPQNVLGRVFAGIGGGGHRRRRKA